MSTPTHESARLEALRRYGVLDTVPEQAFDDLVALAAHVCGTPVALISLLDSHRQWFKAKVGLTVAETSRDISFCTHAIRQSGLFIVPDALADERFATNPLVTSDPKIRFYAGAPLVAPDGAALGTLCVIDRVPRDLGPAQAEALRILSRQVIALLEMRRQAIELAGLEAEQAQAAAAEASRRRILAMAELLPVGVFRTDGSGQCVYVNTRWCEIAGLTPEQAMGEGWARALHPDDRGRVFEEWQRSAAERVPFKSEYRFQRPDGMTTWVLGQATAYDRDAGEVGYLGTITDITERKRAEDALLRQARVERVVADVSLAFTEGGTLRDVLQQCVELVVRRLDFAAARIWTLNSDDDVLDLQASAGMSTDLDGAHHRGPVGHLEIGRIAQQRRPYATNAIVDDLGFGDEERARREGRVAFIGHPLLVGDRLVGAMAALAGTPLAEVTGKNFETVAGKIAECIERNWAEAALQRSEEHVRQLQRLEAVGRLAGGIAHDFNNLLTVVTGRAEILLQRLPPGERLRRDVELIHRTAARAASLTGQLLAFSRKQILAPKVLDLNTVVPGMAAMLQRLIGEEMELVFRPGVGLRRVKSDPGQLEQVLVNLVVNARDAMPHGGRVTIETADVELDARYVREHAGVRPGRYAMLAVSDTGVGMDAGTQARMFEPFFTTKELGKGTGLGLATVYGIVKQSGGNIWVYSEPGKGTTFKIYLPRVEDAEDTPEAPLARPGRGTETVLLTEDEDEVRALAREILESYGYTVIEASRPAEAIEIGERFLGPIHLLVTDVVMPQMSGRALAERLGPQRPEMKILFISGYTDDAIVHHGVLDPGTPFVQKPFTPAGLARKVREVLDAGD